MAPMTLMEPTCPVPDIARADMDAAVEAARAAVGLPVGARVVAAMSGGVDSTVDLSTEFTGLITTQRAYSASSKIITTADQMLEELLMIKR